MVVVKEETAILLKENGQEATPVGADDAISVWQWIAFGIFMVLLAVVFGSTAYVMYIT